MVGVLAFRDITHISLLFVKKSHHRRGIAKELLRIGINDIKNANEDITQITVNSSPYAVNIYKKLGFLPIDKMKEKDGIKYTPMKMTI